LSLTLFSLFSSWVLEWLAACRKNREQIFTYLKWFLGAAFILALIIVYYNFNPSYAGFFPQCPFWKATGFLCPGCGSQRAIHSLLNMDLLNALSFNPLLVISLPLIILGFALDLFKEKSEFLKNTHRIAMGQTSVYSMVAVIIVFWIVRNL